MIQVAGLGASGSYLFRRLADAGFDVTGYDPKKPDFYIPCGYAVNIEKLGELSRNVNLDAGDYIEATADTVTFASDSGVRVELPAKGFATIDKNHLERDILGELKFERKMAPTAAVNDYILVDATGISRHYLGKAHGDLQMRTKEYLTDTSPGKGFHFRYFPSGRGYYWEFPLKNGFHIGAGGDSIDIVSDSLKDIKGAKRVMSRNIRLSPLFDQASSGNVIGVGEAIGTVSPITGEGIVPSMESAEILFKCISRYDDLESLKESYGAEIKKKFRRYEKLSVLLGNARQGKLKKLGNLSAVLSAKEDFQNFGIQLEILKVLRQLAKN